MAERVRKKAVEQFILENVEKHPGDIAALTAARFEFSRQAAHHHLRRMVDAGLLTATGRTRDRRYAPALLLDQTIDLAVADNRAEAVVWRQHVAPRLEDLPRNVRDICNYGFSEMYNNVVDHSRAEGVCVIVQRTSTTATIRVHDNGVGIFRKIRAELGLSDDRDAALQLAKGKLTTDPTSHTGEGIFFASRMFDRFTIVSDHLGFVHLAPDDDWILEDRRSSVEGTGVWMRISVNSARTRQQVLDKFAGPEDYAFSRTHVPVILAQYGADDLVSRSQARRVLARFEKFKEVIVDFHEVTFIGPAFADEIFRVFAREHPEVTLTVARAVPQVEAMIRRARGGADEGQPGLFG